MGNLIIIGKANTMMHQANAPHAYWAEAVLAVVQLSNVTLTKGNRGVKKPYEMWLKKKPEIENLRIWECLAYKKAFKPNDKK